MAVAGKKSHIRPVDADHQPVSVQLALQHPFTFGQGGHFRRELRLDEGRQVGRDRTVERGLRRRSRSALAFAHTPLRCRAMLSVTARGEAQASGRRLASIVGSRFGRAI